MGGYYVELINASGDKSSSVEEMVGGLSISGSLISEADVPVPSSSLQH
jgi:hypothetical protein